MSMEVWGKNPKSEVGRYFCNINLEWRELVDYLSMTIPAELFHKCLSWKFNDGAGLEEEDSLKVAELLQKDYDDGHTAFYAEEHKKLLTSYPFRVTNVVAFIAFLKDCGGFEIF